jgi:ferredoxin
MPNVTVIYGEEIKSAQVALDSLLGDAIIATGLPLEQPCAGRGTCGKCKVLVEGGVTPYDEIEIEHLTPGERAINYRLA